MGGCQINFTVSCFPDAHLGRWQDKSNEVVISTFVCSVSGCKCSVNLHWWRMQKTKQYCIFTFCDQVINLMELGFLKLLRNWFSLSVKGLLLLRHACCMYPSRKRYAGPFACPCVGLLVCLGGRELCGPGVTLSFWVYLVLLICLWWHISDLLSSSWLVRWV